MSQVPSEPSWQDMDEVPESPTNTVPSNPIITEAINKQEEHNSSNVEDHDTDLIIDDELYQELLQDHHDEGDHSNSVIESTTEQQQYHNERSSPIHHPSSPERNDTTTTVSSLYEYQDGFSSDIHNKSIENILDVLYSNDYPPSPLQLIENDETYDFPFPTKSQLSNVFRSMKILFLFTFLTRYLSERDNFKREILAHLSTFKVLHRGYRMNHVDVICHDITQQVLLRAPMRLTDIMKLSETVITLNTDENRGSTTLTISSTLKNHHVSTNNTNHHVSTTNSTINHLPFNNEFLSLGDPILDELFETSISKRDGIYGIPIKQTSGGFIIELSGVAGSGKTQLALHLSLQCILNRKFGGLNSRVLYLHSESYPMDRLNEMIQAKTRQLNEYYHTLNTHPTRSSMDSSEESNEQNDISEDDFLNNFIQRNISNTNEFNDLLKPSTMSSMSPLENVIEKRNIRLVILDSIGMLFRDSHASRTLAMDRSEILQFQIQHMKYLATKYKVIFLILNQVSAIFEDEMNNELVRKYHQSHRNDTLNCEEALESYIYSKNTTTVLPLQEVGDISSVRSYFKLTPSEKVKPTLGLHWSSLIDIRLFLTKLNRKDVVIASHSRLRREKKIKGNDTSIVYLRDYETQEPKYESVNDYSRQIHVIYSPFSPTSSRSFLIDSFGVRGV
ncbi:hypothetical protein C9374_008921 [Naegleria lovaniensis]|uniref:RecA family profile 1 domain-containing protein n=1 Tax=Naegleria lovaniensis TaxID=51637 RepID=A0AA88GII3_NAELO|nr:uncharacterized protein C9374_008921 [Naegleria lovaniensis]KAG2377836.1 hypothetical protein C9374_008921 [Naegleria lovaniensis]